MSDDHQLTWLPNLFDMNGNWERKLENLYQEYLKNYVSSKPNFNGSEVTPQRNPCTDNKDYTFWHLIGDGPSDEEKLPNFRRCERINWSRAIIDNSSDPDVKVWEKRVNSKGRIFLFLENYNYLVILERWTKGRIVIRTGFIVIYEDYRKNLLKEYNSLS